MRLLRVLLLVALVALVALVTGCSPDQASPTTAPTPTTSTPAAATPSRTDSPSASPAPSPGPRPAKNGCHRMTFAQAVAPVVSGKDLSCAKPHTSQTFKIGRLSLVSSGHLVAVDSPSVQSTVAASCRSLLGPHVGASPTRLRLSMVQTVWFTPSVADAAAGADWFRCDVVALARAGRLALLPRTSEGMAGSSDRFAMCGTASPAAASFERVPCSARHAWVAVSSVGLAGSAYPSAAQAGPQMEAACRDAARSRASDPLDFTWSEERPTHAQWDAGQRYGICWTPS